MAEVAAARQENGPYTTAWTLRAVAGRLGDQSAFKGAGAELLR